MKFLRLEIDEVGDDCEEKMVHFDYVRIDNDLGLIHTMRFMLAKAAERFPLDHSERAGHD
jgi:hypothetical protein